MMWNIDDDDRETMGPAEFLFVLFLASLVTYVALTVLVLSISGCHCGVGIGRPPRGNPWIHHDELPGDEELEPR